MGPERNGACGIPQGYFPPCTEWPLRFPAFPIQGVTELANRDVRFGIPIFRETEQKQSAPFAERKERMLFTNLSGFDTTTAPFAGHYIKTERR